MIELKTFDKSRVNPVDDGVLYNALAGESGILTGCGLTAVGGAQVQIRDGYLILCGRVCKVSQEVIYANLSTNGVQEGQLVTVIDLSNAENPIKFEVRLPKGELMQEDINAGGTIYELEIATYTADELSVKSITTTANKIGLAKEKTLAQPSGIATLDSSGKLAQMPTAADVGAPDIESGSWTPIMMGSDNTGWYETASSIGRYTRIGNVIVVSLVINVKKVPEAAKEKFVLLGGFPKPFDQRCGMGASFAIPYSTGITRLNSSTGQLFGTVYLNDALILRYPNATSFVNMQGSEVSNNAIIAGQFTYLCK